MGAKMSKLTETVKRKFLFTDIGGEQNLGAVTRVILPVPTWPNPPKFIVFRSKLYRSCGGSGLVYFYHEVKETFESVECERDYTRSEFNKETPEVVI